MKKLGLFLSAVLALSAVSCASTNNEANESRAEEAPETAEVILPVEGSWRLVDYVGTDGSVNEVSEDEGYILQFDGEQHLFGMKTDCNLLGGQYTTVGDSIMLDNISSTLMLCPEEKVEKAMNAIFQRIDTYAINPDSVLRLRSDMRTMATFVRTTEEAANATQN